MSFSYPKIIRKLFADEGKGETLNDAVLPSGLVKYNSAQSLTDSEKESARDNIDAQSKSDLETALNELITEFQGK